MKARTPFRSVPLSRIPGDEATHALFGETYFNSLAFVAKKFPNPWPAVLFYLLYPLGLIWFAVWPSYNDESPMRALIAGLSFGFFTYATYDITNHATLRNWTVLLTLTDIAWGSALAACCSYFGYVAADRLLASP